MANRFERYPPGFWGVRHGTFMTLMLVPEKLERHIIDEQNISGEFEISNEALTNIPRSDLNFLFHKVIERQTELGINFEFGYEYDVVKSRTIVKWRPIKGETDG